MDWYKDAQEAASFILDSFQKEGYENAETAIIIGSGAAQLLDGFSILARLPFQAIPHLSSATFHTGEIIWAKSSQRKSIIILNGRLHYYEGYSTKEITFPIRILKLLGIKTLLMTNASGGLNPDYEAGELVLIRDHINLMPDHPLRGPNEPKFGLRFPDMSNAYDKALRTHLKALYKSQNNKALKEGVYVGFQGPSLETPAEYKYLNIIGGDMVGMSTVPEVIVASHCGISTAVLSIITNVCYPPEAITETTLEEVIEIAQGAVPFVTPLYDALINEL